MGMDPFNFADALLGILAQRLVRTFCSQCKKAQHPTPQEYEHLKGAYGAFFDERVAIPYDNGLTLYGAAGCPSCKQSGYRGRMGLYEFLEGTDAIKQLIIGRATVDEIRTRAVNDGMTTLLQDGIHKIFLGHTDYKQVSSVCLR